MNGESSLHQPVVLELVANKSRYNLRQEYEGVTPCTYHIKGILQIGQPSKNTAPYRANHSCASRLEGWEVDNYILDTNKPALPENVRLKRSSYEL